MEMSLVLHQSSHGRGDGAMEVGTSPLSQPLSTDSQVSQRISVIPRLRHRIPNVAGFRVPSLCSPPSRWVSTSVTNSLSVRLTSDSNQHACHSTPPAHFEKRSPPKSENLSHPDSLSSSEFVSPVEVFGNVSLSPSHLMSTLTAHLNYLLQVSPFVFC